MPRLIWVFIGRTNTLLVLSCPSSDVDGMAINVDPDQTAPYEQSDLCLQYLPAPPVWILWIITIRALSWENLSSGFSTRYDSNRPTQRHKLARVLKKPIWQLHVEVLYYLGSEQQRRWSDCADVQADLSLCCSHMAKTGFLMTGFIKRLETSKWYNTSELKANN